MMFRFPSTRTKLTSGRCRFIYISAPSAAYELSQRRFAVPATLQQSDLHQFHWKLAI